MLPAAALKALALIDINFCLVFTSAAIQNQVYRFCIRLNLHQPVLQAVWTKQMSILHCQHFTMIFV